MEFDPLLTDEIGATGARPWTWEQLDPELSAIITQTADPLWRSLAAAWFPALGLFFEGRNSVRAIRLPASVMYGGIGGRR